MRGQYVWYVQHIDHLSDPMMGQAFTTLWEMNKWVHGREDLFRYFRYDAWNATCKALPSR